MDTEPVLQCVFLIICLAVFFLCLRYVCSLVVWLSGCLSVCPSIYYIELLFSINVCFGNLVRQPVSRVCLLVV